MRRHFNATDVFMVDARLAETLRERFMPCAIAALGNPASGGVNLDGALLSVYCQGVSDGVELAVQRPELIDDLRSGVEVAVERSAVEFPASHRGRRQGRKARGLE